MHSLRVAKLATTLALGNRSPFLLYFIQRPVCMSTGRRTVALDAGLAEHTRIVRTHEEWEAGSEDLPSKFLAVYEYL